MPRQRMVEKGGAWPDVSRGSMWGARQDPREAGGVGDRESTVSGLQLRASNLSKKHHLSNVTERDGDRGGPNTGGAGCAVC